MNRIVFFFLCIFISYPYLLKSQEILVRGSVRDKSSVGIAYANVFNKSSNTFTYTDSIGNFSLNCSLGDILELSHIAYQTKEVKVENAVLPISLEIGDVLLNEVVVATPSQTPKIKVPKKRVRHQGSYGLSANFDYIFNVKNTSQHNILVQNLIIPYRFVDNDPEVKYSKEGVLVIQIKKGNKNNMDSLLCKHSYNYEMKDLLKKRKLIIPVEDITLAPNQSIFLLLRRVIPNKTFNAKQLKTLSVNPFLWFSEKNKSGNHCYFKLFNQEWHQLSEWFGYSPAFDIRIEGRIITDVE